MNEELKTFVYVSKEAVGSIGSQLGALKSKVLKALLTCVIMIVLITSVCVIRADARKTAAESFENTAAPMAESRAELTDTDVSEISTDMETNLLANHSTSDSENIPVTNYTKTTENDDESIVLLSLDDMTGFSPIEEELSGNEEKAVSAKAQDVAQRLEDGLPDYEFSSRLEAVEDAAEEETSNYKYSSRLDEVGAKIEDATRPKDVPHKLKYVYNKRMVLNPDADEISVLERIVEAEAGDQDVYGRMLVANVIINRIYHKEFADTISGVVFEKIGNATQFSPVRDGRYYSVTVSKETKEAVARVLAGEDYSEGAVYFFMRSKTTAEKASWFDTDLKFLFKYGCHEFFKDK